MCCFVHLTTHTHSDLFVFFWRDIFILIYFSVVWYVRQKYSPKFRIRELISKTSSHKQCYETTAHRKRILHTKSLSYMNEWNFLVYLLLDWFPFHLNLLICTRAFVGVFFSVLFSWFSNSCCFEHSIDILLFIRLNSNVNKPFQGYWREKPYEPL